MSLKIARMGTLGEKILETPIVVKPKKVHKAKEKVETNEDNKVK